MSDKPIEEPAELGMDISESPNIEPEESPYVLYLCRATALCVAAGVLAIFGMIIISREIGVVTGGLFGIAAIILGVMVQNHKDANMVVLRTGRRGVIYGGLVILGTLFFGFMDVGVRRIRPAAARSQSTNNLKQIGIAIHSHNDAALAGTTDDEDDVKDKN
jgi:membrane associated rhomboid family serine protease